MAMNFMWMADLFGMLCPARVGLTSHLDLTSKSRIPEVIKVVCLFRTLPVVTGQSQRV